MRLLSAGPRQSSRDERRGLLARQFMEVVEPLLDDGEAYADISVARLIAATGISRSTFYVYFDDKGDLLGAMTADITQSFLESGAAWFDLEPGATKEQIRAGIGAVFATYRAHRTLLSAITELAATDPHVREGHERLVATAAEGIEGHIRAHQAAGAIDASIDAEATAEWLVWMLERGLHQLVRPADDRRADRLLDAMTELVWRTLYTPAP